MKYGEWLTEWLNNYVRISAKHRTIERYSEIINNHLACHFFLQLMVDRI